MERWKPRHHARGFINFLKEMTLTMKNTILIPTLFLTALLGWNCGSNSTDMDKKTDYPAKPVADQTNVPSAEIREAPTADAEVLSILATVNQNEINAATEARKKTISKPVMDYANMLYKAHSDNLTKTKEVAQTIHVMMVTSDETNKLQKKGADELEDLSTKDRKDFEMDYVKAMVKGHEDVLDLIDNKLMKNAQNEAVKMHLTETRKHVQMHLDEGTRLKDSM